MNRYVGLFFFLAITALAAYAGSLFTPGDWYSELAKPAWTSPNWVFGPAWTALYIIIAFAGWLTWRHGGLGLPLMLWIIQLGLNAAWSYLMFGEHDILSALIDISAMWLVILGFILAVRQISGLAALLFVPYLLWVSYALALNGAIWQLNPVG
ncbi:MAG: TspO/MBR family protein [Hyphomicrobiaceae bacterium]